MSLIRGSTAHTQTTAHIAIGYMQSSERDVKLQDITTQVLEQLATSCLGCSDGIIDRQSFACLSLPHM